MPSFMIGRSPLTLSAKTPFYPLLFHPSRCPKEDPLWYALTSLLAVIRDWYGACQSLSFQGDSLKLPRKAISSRPANQNYAIPLYRLGFLSSIAQHTHSCLTSTSSMLAIRFSPLYIRFFINRAEPGFFLSVRDLSYWVRVVLLLLQKGIKKRTPLRLALHLNKMD